MVEDGIEVAVFIYLISDLDEFFWAQYCAKGASFAQGLVDFYPCQDFDTPLYSSIYLRKIEGIVKALRAEIPLILGPTFGICWVKCGDNIWFGSE